jgi:uncharacterized protein (PEP-CTERM system associated)
MRGRIASSVVGRARRARQACAHAAWSRLVVGLGCTAVAVPGLADNWKVSASASVTETYTTNVNFSPQSQAENDFATSLTGTIGIHGEGPRLKLDGSISATGIFYIDQSQNNSFAPNVNLHGTVEAIEKFFWVDATANINQTFLSPFGPQPTSLVNQTQNRYTQQTYTVSPYIKGLLGSNISYQVRDDNYWTIASNYGNNSTAVPNTYGNALTASINKDPNPVGWTLEYDRLYYDNGLGTVQVGDVATVGNGSFTSQQARLIVPWNVDPLIQIAPRVGYERNDFPLQSSSNTIYGIGGQWRPSDRTQLSGYWEHRFFGGSYQAQISHRLPNVAFTADFQRGITSYPQLALSIPAGASVSQFVDAAFTTRIPDPAERAIAVQQFLANSGLPAVLSTPVNFYGTSLTLQQSVNVQMVLIGKQNSVSFNVFHVISNAISAQGNVLPPALAFGQNNTQTGGGVSYSHPLWANTNFSANATYSRTEANSTTGPLQDTRSNNATATAGIGTSLGPKTSLTANVTYQWYNTPGSTQNTGNVSSFNASVTLSHTFY